MFQSVLVTGAGGFVGQHVVECLDGVDGPEVGALVHDENNLEADDTVNTFAGDLLDRDCIRSMVDSFQPDAVIHLAGDTNPGRSFQAPNQFYRVNIIGQSNLISALQDLGHTVRLLLPGSAHEYGGVQPDDCPLEETHGLRPESPYAVSKAAQSLMGIQAHAMDKLEIVRTRAFNHTGPGQSDQFVCPQIAKQVVQVERGQTNSITIQNGTPRRDFTDVRDVTRAYWTILNDGSSGEVYNVCHQQAWSIREIADLVVQQSSLESTEIHEESGQTPDVPVLKGSNRKLKRQLGWSPQIPLSQTMNDLLQEWRDR